MLASVLLRSSCEETHSTSMVSVELVLGCRMCDKELLFLSLGRWQGDGVASGVWGDGVASGVWGVAVGGM